MILYHVITTYHLLSAMTIQAAKEEEAVLLVPRWIPIKFPHYKQLEQLFKEIIVIDTGYRFKHTPEETDRYFKSAVPPLDNFSDIYIWGAQMSFGIYAAENEIPFIYCEEATGMLSRSEILEHIDRIDPTKGITYPYVKELGLYTGDVKSQKTVLCNKAAQLEDYTHDNLTHFSVVEGLMELPEDRRKMVIGFFINFDEIHVPENSTVIFTQHFANLRLTTFEDQALVYQTFVDYFFNDRTLVIKPHPDDLMYYSMMFPDAAIVRERFPSEFLPFVLDNDPQCVATIYSTAIYNLRGHYPEVFELDLRYEKEFKKNNRYYAALCTAQKLGKRVVTIGCYDLLIKKLCERMGISDVTCCAAEDITSADIADSLVIVDDITELCDEGRDAVQAMLAAAGEDTAVMFTNYCEDYCWYSYDKKQLWDSIVPVVMQKKRREEAYDEIFFAPLDDEVLYLYSKSGTILERVKTMEINKELPHVGVDMTKQPMTKEEEKIKTLEGILAATEQRLLHYMDRVRELEKK